MRSVSREFAIENESLEAYYYWNATTEIDRDGEMVYFNVDGPVTVCYFDPERTVEEEFDNLPVRVQTMIEDYTYETIMGW